MRNRMPEGIDENVIGITSFRENGRRKTFFHPFLYRKEITAYRLGVPPGPMAETIIPHLVIEVNAFVNK